MFKINRKIEYALIALKHMSTKYPGELTTAKEVADTYKCSFDVTARVMQLMAQKGWLKSEQGVAGGYQITKDLAKVSLYDLFAMILGPLNLVKCLYKGTPCDIESKCNIVSPLANLNDLMVEFLRGVSVREVIENNIPSAGLIKNPRVSPSSKSLRLE